MYSVYTAYQMNSLNTALRMYNLYTVLQVYNWYASLELYITITGTKVAVLLNAFVQSNLKQRIQQI